jgi:hypothetical protein
MMTNRDFIFVRKHLPPDMAIWLRPFFAIDISDVKIVIKQVWEYGREWKAVSDGLAVYIDATYWWDAKPSTNELLQLLAHEFTHVQQARTIGWLRYQWRNLVTVWRSIGSGKIYDHRKSPDEDEAEQMRQRVFDTIWPLRDRWQDLLDERATA